MTKYLREKKNKTEYTIELNLLKKTYNVIELKSINDITEKNLYKALGKDTLFCIVTSSSEELKTVKQKELPRHCHIHVYMSADLYNKILMKNKQTLYKEFRSTMLLTNPKISKKCIYQLYVRTDKSIEKSVEIVNNGVTTVRQLDKVIPPLDMNIYASDIILPILNKKLPKTYMHDLAIFFNTLGEKGAFYAINKYLNTLYELKLNQLLGNIPKDKEWMEDLLKKIMVNELLDLKLEFNNSHYKMLKIILQERINNVRF